MRAILLATIASFSLAFPVLAQTTPSTLRLMTGPQGGVWVPLGGSLKAAFEEQIKGVSVQTLPGAGISNIRGVHEGKAEIGFGNSITTVDGIEGREPFPGKTTKVCQVANLYPQYFQIVALADAKVNDFADLKGKTIAVQPKGNTAELITQHILQANGMSYQSLGKVSFVNSYTDAASLLKDGHAQVFTLGTTVPASSVMDVASGRDIKLLGVDDRLVAEMKKINKGYYKIPIKAGTYPKQDKDIDVIGYSAHLVASCDLPADLVYNLTKVVANHVKEMSSINKAMEGLTAKQMAEDIGVPFHPGAMKYYKEVGAH